MLASPAGEATIPLQLRELEMATRDGELARRAAQRASYLDVAQGAFRLGQVLIERGPSRAPDERQRQHQRSAEAAIGPQGSAHGASGGAGATGSTRSTRWASCTARLA